MRRAPNAQVHLEGPTRCPSYFRKLERKTRFTATLWVMETPRRTTVERLADTSQVVAVVVVAATLILPTSFPWSFIALGAAFAVAMLANRYTSAEQRISQLFRRRLGSPLRGTEAPAPNEPKSSGRSGTGEA